VVEVGRESLLDDEAATDLVAYLMHRHERDVLAEFLKVKDQLPAEARPRNTKHEQFAASSIFCLRWASLHTSHLLGILGLVTWLVIIHALAPCAVLPSFTQFATAFYLPASLSALLLSPSTLITTVDFFDGQAEFASWRKMAADRNQWRAVCGSKMPSATKETPTSSREGI
jgi:hypothetical protein